MIECTDLFHELKELHHQYGMVPGEPLLKFSRITINCLYKGHIVVIRILRAARITEEHEHSERMKVDIFCVAAVISDPFPELLAFYDGSVHTLVAVNRRKLLPRDRGNKSLYTLVIAQCGKMRNDKLTGLSIISFSLRDPENSSGYNICITLSCMVISTVNS